MKDSRRAFLGLLSAGVAGLAGCGSDGEPAHQTGPEGRPGMENGRYTGRSGKARVDTNDLEGDVLKLMVRIPYEIRLNPYAARGSALPAWRRLQAPVLPVDRSTGEYRPSGHTWSVDGEEVTVPALIADYAVEGTDAVRYTVDERFTYWNGDPITARAFHLNNRLRALGFYSGIDGEYGGELVSDTEFRSPLGDELNRAGIRPAIHPGLPPLPPAFTEPWVERLADATTKAAVDETYTELSLVEMTFQWFAEKGWGTGAYAIEEPADAAPVGIVAGLREDHPGEATVENLVLENVQPYVIDEAKGVKAERIDLGNGIVSTNGGFSAPAMPERIEELGRYRTSGAGFKLLFDWGDPHMARLPVRRAVVTALPIGDLMLAVSGDRMTPPVHDSGMLSADTRALGADFCDSLHRYLREPDIERAAAWMREAGYALENGQWVGPDGGTPSVTIPTTSSPRFSEPTKAVVNALADFGFDASWRVVMAGNGEMSDALRERYGLAVSRVGGGWTPANQYGSTPGVSNGRPYGATVAPGRSPLATCTDAPAPATTPSEVTIPKEPGALRIESAEYEGDTDYVHATGETINPCADSNALWDPELDAASARAAARRCARWYNYALPTFVFAGPQTGVWGDTEAFDYPRDPRALGTADPVSSDPLRYLVQAGLVR